MLIMISLVLMNETEQQYISTVDSTAYSLHERNLSPFLRKETKMTHSSYYV